MAKKKKKYPNSSLLRRLQIYIQAYPSPKYFNLFNTYVKANEMNESEAACIMIRNFFDNMPESEKLRLRSITEDNNFPNL